MENKIKISNLKKEDLKIEITNVKVGEIGAYYHYDSEIEFDIIYKPNGKVIGKFVSYDHQGNCKLGPVPEFTDYIWDELEEEGIDGEEYEYDYEKLPDELKEKYDEQYEIDKEQWIEATMEWWYEEDIVEEMLEDSIEEWIELSNGEIVVYNDDEACLIKVNELQQVYDLATEENIYKLSINDEDIYFRYDEYDEKITSEVRRIEESKTKVTEEMMENYYMEDVKVGDIVYEYEKIKFYI